MSVSECQRRITSREFAEWIAYCGIEPFGPERAELSIAIAAAAICNCLGAKNLTPKDLIPDFEQKGQSEAVMEAKMQLFTQAFAQIGQSADG